jgi:hypothetical protein
MKQAPPAVSIGRDPLKWLNLSQHEWQVSGDQIISKGSGGYDPNDEEAADYDVRFPDFPEHGSVEMWEYFKRLKMRELVSKYNEPWVDLAMELAEAAREDGWENIVAGMIANCRTEIPKWFSVGAPISPSPAEIANRLISKTAQYYPDARLVDIEAAKRAEIIRYGWPRATANFRLEENLSNYKYEVTMWHWGRRLQDEPDLTFDETWEQIDEEWEKVSELYERIRIRLKHEERTKDTRSFANRTQTTEMKPNPAFSWNSPQITKEPAPPERAPDMLPSEQAWTDRNGERQEAQEEMKLEPEAHKVQEQEAEISKRDTQDLSSDRSAEALVPEIKQELSQEESPETSEPETKPETVRPAALKDQEIQSQVLEVPKIESTTGIEDKREEEQRRNLGEELGDHIVVITRTSEGKWEFEKKSDLSTPATYPLPRRISDMEISHFCGVQERYIQAWKRTMPRYTREQLRLAFEEYVQTYGWTITAAESGWGTLDQYIA